MLSSNCGSRNFDSKMSLFHQITKGYLKMIYDFEILKSSASYTDIDKHVEQVSSYESKISSEDRHRDYWYNPIFLEFLPIWSMLDGFMYSNNETKTFKISFKKDVMKQQVNRQQYHYNDTLMNVRCHICTKH